jgi:hypothetical protein
MSASAPLEARISLLLRSMIAAKVTDRHQSLIWQHNHARSYFSFIFSLIGRTHMFKELAANRGKETKKSYAVATVS